MAISGRFARLFMQQPVNGVSGMDSRTGSLNYGRDKKVVQQPSASGRWLLHGHPACLRTQAITAHLHGLSNQT